ncbi:hypothetical protein CSUB01_04318 [Colletotrichum sublineola]|uniref:Uncharacterized protein n=1 Tax=Colletotrichum sublineola TaxID=1173701 RepID=A0A066WWM5_COLSU|nr:hypothetical protein CSUB01_04318 [Colletotrichum sublineola]
MEGFGGWLTRLSEGGKDGGMPASLTRVARAMANWGVQGALLGNRPWTDVTNGLSHPSEWFDFFHASKATFKVFVAGSEWYQVYTRGQVMMVFNVGSGSAALPVPTTASDMRAEMRPDAK